MCRNVLYHFKDADKQKFLEKAYKVLKPGGYFCIESDRDIQDYDMYLKAGFFQPFPYDYPTILQKPYNVGKTAYFN